MKKKKMGKLRNYSTVLDELKSEFKDAEISTERFFEKEIKKAAGEARKSLQNVRNLAKELRVIIQTIKKEM